MSHVEHEAAMAARAEDLKIWIDRHMKAEGAILLECSVDTGTDIVGQENGYVVRGRSGVYSITVKVLRPELRETLRDVLERQAKVIGGHPLTSAA